MVRYKLIFLLVFSSVFNGLALIEFKPGMKALVKVPVADLASRALSDFGKNVERDYADLTHAPHSGFSSCLRLHQLRFNEVVTIVKSVSEHEVECTVPELLYIAGLGPYQSRFWMLKKDLVPLNQLKKGLDQYIPMNQQELVILKEPWTFKKDGRTYSAGTRFMRSEKHDTQDSYAVKILKLSEMTVAVALIPKRRAILLKKNDFEYSRALFVSILKPWACPKTGFIPYVFGGCSYTALSSHNEVKKIHGKRCGHRASFWQRSEVSTRPLSGFDCSNMILCAAQMAGLPYCYKNTGALARGLTPIKPHEPLENGDLLWYSGHVLVVSDVKNNKCIEAVGYDSGYGRVHEISLGRVFKGIKDYKELLQAQRAKKILQRLNKAGIPYKTVRLKILKLKSIVSKKLSGK